MSHNIFTLKNLYLAYKKAKTEAFFENTHFHAVEFTKYEQNLHKNLQKLLKRLSAKKSDWFKDISFIGDYAYLPKSINTPDWNDKQNGHFVALDPLEEWERLFNEAETKASASLRLIIRPSVDFQIVSALWVIYIGEKFDKCLIDNAVYANRLRRLNSAQNYFNDTSSNLNLAAPALFNPYFSAYKNWRENGLNAMEKSLQNKNSILAITMDIEKFYHKASPNFIIKDQFLSMIGVELTDIELRFSKQLLNALEAWYKSTPDFQDRKQISIPVGLSASKIIANILLFEFDKAIVEKLKPIYYGRYVDDIFLVINSDTHQYNAKNVSDELIRALDPIMSKEINGIRLKLEYSEESDLIFASEKQKIFSLSSDHGADLVHHIRNQIREKSSEYRMLPNVPETSMEMVSKALLLTPDATIQADALRKADDVSIKRFKPRG